MMLKPEDRLQTAQIAYDHLKSKRADDEASTGVYLTRVHRMMTYQIVLVAAASFASKEVGWAEAQGGFQFWGLLICGGLGLASLAIGFLYGIQCTIVRDASTTSVKLLEKILEDKTILVKPPDELLAELGSNLAQEMNENRGIRNTPKRKRHATNLNRFTIAGFGFVVLFVTWAVVGGKLVPNQHLSKGNVQMYGDQDGQGTQGTGPAEGGAAGQDDGAPEGAPSAVEPSSTEQKTATPAVPSAAEGTETIQLSEEPPKGDSVGGPEIEIRNEE